MIDTSNFSGLSSMQDMAFATNNAVGGVLVNGFIIALFFIILIGLLRRDEFRENALLVASWVTFLVSMLLWAAKLTIPQYPLAFLTLAAITTIYLYATRR